MKIRFLCGLAVVGMSFGLVGCGGTSGGTPGAVAPEPEDAEVAENWTGSVVTSDGTTLLKQENVSGTLLRSTGQLTVKTAIGTFVSNGGPDAAGTYTASNGDTAQRFERNLIAKDYSYMLPLFVTQKVAGTNYVSSGVVGLPTTPEVMGIAAKGATATYTGEAAIIAEHTVNGTVRHASSNTQIVADFAAGTVSATMDGITVPSGKAATIDHMAINGAAISGGSFSGGTATATLGGANALPAITGGGETTDVSGNFFGSSHNGTRPDEVGGVVLIDGNTGSVSATFVGD